MSRYVGFCGRVFWGLVLSEVVLLIKNKGRLDNGQCVERAYGQGLRGGLRDGQRGFVAAAGD